MFTFADMTSLASNSKLCNFITSLKLIQTPQNFVQVSFSIKLKKYVTKTDLKFWPQVPFKITEEHFELKKNSSMSF